MKGTSLVRKTKFRTKKFANKYGSTILTIMAGVGVIGTVILTADATIKALEEVNAAETEKGEPLTPEEKLKTAWHYYILPASAAAVTITCAFGANILNKKQQASLASAYMVLGKSYQDYRKKVIELCGKEVDTEVRDAISLDKYEKAQPVISENDYVLFYDEISGEFFESTLLKVRDAEYHFNRNYALAGMACINELMDWFDLPHVEHGDDFGWSWDLSTDWGYSFIDFEHELVTPKEGVEYYRIGTPFPPCSLMGDPLVEYNGAITECD